MKKKQSQKHKRNNLKPKESFFVRRRGLMLVSILPIFLLSAPSLTAYAEGYRLIGGAVVKTGAIEITSSEHGSVVYVDGKQRSSNDGLKEGSFGDLPPGEYEVLILKKGFMPWKEEVKVSAGETTKLSAELVSKEVENQVAIK